MSFNAAAARAKRPCPLWVDAFLRDTQHLEADEVGAYMLILMVMWSRESCDYPDDDHRLARVSRVSLRLWKSRIGPVLRPFFQSSEGALISKRLREEATYVERQCKAQSDRKTGEKSDKPLKDNKPNGTTDRTADHPADTSRDHPSYNPTLEEEESSAAAAGPTTRASAVAAAQASPDFHDQVLEAAGIDVAKDVRGKWHSSSQRWVSQRWIADLGLTEGEVLAELRAKAAAMPKPPGSLAYFDPIMAEAAGRKSAPRLVPIDGSARAPAPPRDLDAYFDRVIAEYSKPGA